MKKGLDIPIIRYANCWEDASVLLQALNTGTGKEVLSIASGGDNSFALLLLDPKHILAFDINPIQLYLCELKSAAIKHLEYEQCVSFLGFSASQKRWETYQKIRGYLSEDAGDFFDHEMKMIKRGVIRCGKFEKYFEKFRKWIMPWIHSRKGIRRLLSPKSEEMQQKYYFHKWNSRRWKWLFRLFYSRMIMGLFGRSPRFHRYVEFNVGEFIYSQAEKHLQKTNCQENEYLHFIFKGFFAPRLPVYMRKENFNIIKSRIDRISWFCGDLNAALDKMPVIDLCNLSDIFEYMSHDETLEYSKKITGKMNENGRAVYWNLMVDRDLANGNAMLQTLTEKEEELKVYDKGFFYKTIKINQKKNE